MPEPTWKETRSEREWEIVVDAVRVVVHMHIDEPGAWFASFHPDFGGRTRLYAQTPEAARKEALNRLRVRATSIVNEIDRIRKGKKR